LSKKINEKWNVSAESWVMILGGYNSSGVLDSVELFNIDTHQSCNFGKMPVKVSSSVGGVLNGFPVFCGGFYPTWATPQSSCYKYQNSWTQVNLILNLRTF